MIKPYIENRQLEIGIAILLFLVGALLFKDAYEGRGKSSPWWSQPFTFM